MLKRLVEKLKEPISQSKFERFVMRLCGWLCQYTHLGFWIRRKYYEVESKIIDRKLRRCTRRIERAIKKGRGA